MTQHLRIANADFRPRRPGDFAQTEAARDILRSLELLRHKPEPGVVMIAGAPGVGKTMALRYFVNTQGHDAFRLEIGAGEGSAFGVACALLRVFGVQGNGMSLVAARELLVRYIGAGRMVALDDCHNLEPKGADWVRSLADEAGFDLVLCGGLDLQYQVNRIASLRSRVHANRPVALKRNSRADVASLVEGSAYATDAAITLLHAVAPIHDGGLRNVEAAVRHAGLFAGSERPTIEHLRWAIRDLKLEPKGTEA